jgi:hypothetical protein
MIATHEVLMKKLVSLADAEEIVLWDTSNLALRCFFQRGLLELTRTDGYPVGHIHGVVMKLQAYIRDRIRVPTAMVFALDEYPKWKYDLYGEYKGKRKNDFKKYLTDPSSFPEFHPVKDVIKMLTYTPCTMVSSVGEECDDVIASFCKKYNDRPLRVISSDKDLWQLLRMPHVSIGEKELITEADVKKEFGLTLPETKKISLYKAIKGDKSDNIPCIPFLFQKIKSAFYECDGSLKDLVLKMPKGKQRSLLLTHVEQIQRMHKLTRLNRKLDFKETMYDGNSKHLNFFLRKYECISVLGKSALFYL